MTSIVYAPSRGCAKAAFSLIIANEMTRRGGRISVDTRSGPFLVPIGHTVVSYDRRRVVTRDPTGALVTYRPKETR